MSSWNRDILNRFIAPGIADFTEAAIPEPLVEGEQVEHWMANHFLNSVFRAEYADKQRQLAFNIIYRAQACFETFEHARTLTAAYLEGNEPANPRSGKYYRALRAWEACFLHLQTFVELLVGLTSTRVFEKGDGSPEQRAYEVANTVKHWGQIVGRDEHLDDDTVPMWLTNAGFATRNGPVTYVELSNLLSECAAVANDLRDPYVRANADA
jgi:hypothetical protein